MVVSRIIIIIMNIMKMMYYSKVIILDGLWSEKNACRKFGLYGTIITVVLSGVEKGGRF